MDIGGESAPQTQDSSYPDIDDMTNQESSLGLDLQLSGDEGQFPALHLLDLLAPAAELLFAIPMLFKKRRLCFIFTNKVITSLHYSKGIMYTAVGSCVPCIYTVPFTL